MLELFLEITLATVLKIEDRTKTISKISSTVVVQEENNGDQDLREHDRV